MNNQSKNILETVEYTFKREEDNKYWVWWDSIKYLLNGNVSLEHIQKIFVMFMLSKFDFLKVSDDLKYFYFNEDKIKGYEEENLKLKLAEIENYLKTYKIVIKGVSDYSMSIKSRGCLIELAKTKYELKETKIILENHFKLINKFKEAFIKLGIDPNELK